jgi:hypothetical protein
MRTDIICSHPSSYLNLCSLDWSVEFDEVGEVTLRRRLGAVTVTVKSEKGMPFSPTQTRTRHTDSFNITECKERSVASHLHRCDGGPHQ